MYQNENLHSLSMTLVTIRNHQLSLITVKAGSKNTMSENTDLDIIREINISMLIL